MLRSRSITLAAACALAALLAVVVAGPATAKQRKLNVHPGNHAIQNAIDTARPDSVLRIHRGRYKEAPVVYKRLNLVAAGRGRPLIDARCKARFAVEVNASNVKLAGLKVIGADGAPGTVPSEVDFTDVSGGVVNDLVLKDTCDAEYGVNVYRAGPTDIKNSRARGFDDAGFYVGGITATPGGAIFVRRSEAYDNNRGVIIESSGGGDIQVLGNHLHDNDVVLPPPASLFAPPTGLLLNAADGVVVQRNRVTNNGEYGLRLAADSDGNVITDNQFLGNPVDVLDLGAGNCGSNNEFQTGDPLPPC